MRILGSIVLRPAPNETGPFEVKFDNGDAFWLRGYCHLLSANDGFVETFGARLATWISLLVALGVRADGQKVLLAIRSMGGESEAAWRALLDDLIKQLPARRR